MSLVIARILIERIREHGRMTYPHECCGLLIGSANGSAKVVTGLRAIPNAREDSPRNRYLISPEDWLQADREARKQGLDIVGVYHSHPDHSSQPSESDKEHAFPWYSYIIVSVAAGEAANPMSWILRDDRSGFDREELDLSD